MKDQLIILVCYIDFIDYHDRKLCANRYNALHAELGKIKYPKGYIIRNIILPIKDEKNPRIECVYPGDATENKNILKKIEEYKNAIKELLK